MIEKERDVVTWNIKKRTIVMIDGKPITKKKPTGVSTPPPTEEE